MHLDDFLELIYAGEIPPEPPTFLDQHGHCNALYRAEKHIYMDYMVARSSCTERGMWAIVTMDWTAQLAEWIGNRKVLEIMAGRGWLAKALSAHGVDIVATDNNSWDERHSKSKCIWPVVPMGALEAVEHADDFDADILIVSWPPYGDDTVCTACDAWKIEKPIVYIGEGDGGCNAPDRFWQHFEMLDDAPDIPLMSWDGIHDHIFIGHYV